MRSPRATPKLVARALAIHLLACLGLTIGLTSGASDPSGKDAEKAQLSASDGELLADPRSPQVRPAPNLSLNARDRDVVDPRVLRLHWILGEPTSLLRAVTSEREATYELPGRMEIEELVTASRSALQAGRRFGVETQAEITLSRLSDLLLTSVREELLAKSRLEIFADGVLLQLPFAALPLPSQSRRPRALAPGLQPLLVDALEIVLHTPKPTGAVRRSSSSHPAQPRTAAVFADPVYSFDDPRLRHGRAHQLETHSTDSMTRSPRTYSPGSFSRLAYAAAEAESILALLPPSQVLFASGFEASRERFLGSDLRDFRILHLATHSVLDAERDGAPALVFSTVNADGRPRASLLTAEDIERLELSADLVVLSACRTALGRELRDDSLAGAFLDAGARRVVVSLWEVGDRATAELMSRFYRVLLQDGLAPATSLQQAQRSMRHDPAWSSPYFWAGFVVQGDLGSR